MLITFCDFSIVNKSTNLELNFGTSLTTHTQGYSVKQNKMKKNQPK